MRIYELLTRPIILYGAEAWTLSEDIFERLRASKRKILRRINGVIYIERASGELDTGVNCGLYADVDIVRHIRVRRKNWIGHIDRMDGTRKFNQIFSSQPESVRKIGRPRPRWWECV
jgi:hypothetical protein